MKMHLVQPAMKGLVSVVLAIVLPIIVISMVVSHKPANNYEKSNSVENRDTQ